LPHAYLIAPINIFQFNHVLPQFNSILKKDVQQ